MKKFPDALPLLHPDRIRAALALIEEEADADPAEFGGHVVNTFKAALRRCLQESGNG